jgi:hypothetical protein
VWLDDWPALLVRSRRVQCCYAFDVKALKGFNAASQQGKEAYWQQESTGELAGEKVVLNQKIGTAGSISGHKPPLVGGS